MFSLHLLSILELGAILLMLSAVSMLRPRRHGSNRLSGSGKHRSNLAESEQ